MSTPRVPFSILTGFLGAGKTTVLNRVLGASHERRVAVLVNELGRVAIDSRLIVRRGGDVLELAGGCVCCKIDVKNDLWDGIVDIIERSRPEHVVLETTGIAEPDAIWSGLDRLPPQHRARIAPAGVVCVVDAEAGHGQLDARPEAREQVIAADRVMLSKLDRTVADEVAPLHARIIELNPDAERAAFPQTPEGTAALVSWLLDVRDLSGRSSRRGRSHHHSHLGQVGAATFVSDAPIVREPLLALVESMRDRLFRVKGFVHLHDEPRRGFLELAGARLDLTVGEPWAAEKPRTELVFIGDGLDEPALRRQLWACRAE